MSCNYQYQRQPGKANCNPESLLPLQLSCQIQGNDNFTIQWHYCDSNSSFPPAQGTITSKETLINSTNYNITRQLLNTSQPSLISVLSVLTVEYNQATGYYWCTVNASDSTPNPSQVLNITSTCPFNGDAIMMPKCMTNIGLFETLGSNRFRCADHNMSIDIVDVQLGSIELCEMKGTATTFDITESITHTDRSESSSTTNYGSYTSEEQATTERISINHEHSTTSPTNQFPMHYVWMIVGVAFVLLIAIIIVMLIAIIYLNHKKNKIRSNFVHWPCITLQLTLTQSQLKLA